MAPAESGDCLFTHSNSDPCPRQALLSRLSQSACSHHQKNRPLRQLHAVLRRHLQPEVGGNNFGRSSISTGCQHSAESEHQIEITPARSARQARDTVSAHLSSIGQGNAAVNLVILSAVPRTSAEIVALNDVRASCPPGRNRLPPRVDPSSGLLDRATIVRALETEVSRSRRYSNPLSIVVARLNPVQNESVPIAENPAGDESNALISMGQIIQEETRWADRIGRCDAGQLMLVLPETDARSAAVLVAKFKPRVEAALHRQGVHFGHAEWRRGDDSTLLQRRAFAALDEDDVPAHVPRPGIA